MHDYRQAARRRQGEAMTQSATAATRDAEQVAVVLRERDALA